MRLDNPPAAVATSDAPDDERFEELHCACGHFICFYAIHDGAVSIKCKYCKRWNTLDVSPDPSVEFPS